jgi:glycosyltransferase involved in cell wall biosynthesis
MTAGSYTAVIPAYSAAPYFAETVASILAQSVPPEWIIVVDDGSPDETARVVAELKGPIVYVRQDNTGPGGATTRGIAMVETEYVATIDQDDLWLPDKARLQLARLAADREAAAVFGRVVEFRGDPSSAKDASAYDGWTRTTLMMRTRIAQAALPVVDQPGKLGEMIDWLAMLREAGHRLVMMEEVLALRRLHEGSLTARDRGELSHAYLPIARKALLRHRGRSPKGK